MLQRTSHLMWPAWPLRSTCRRLLRRAFRRGADARSKNVMGRRQTDERANVLVELLPDGVIVLQNGRIVFANSAAAAMHGAESPEQLIGMDALDLVDPAAHDSILQFRAQTIKGEETPPIIRNSVRLDGTMFVCESHRARFPWDGDAAILITIRDVTEREQAREILRDGDLRVRGILEHVADSVITIDDRGIVQSFNPAAERLFGYRADAVIGRNVAMLMGEPDRKRHDTYIRNYLQTGSGKIVGVGAREVVARRRDGEKVTVELTVSDMHTGGKRVFIGAMRDVTERKQAEKALHDSESRYRDLIEGSKLGICIAANDGGYLYLNQAFRDLFGYGADDEIVYTAGVVVAPHDRERLERQFKDRSSGVGAPEIYEFDGLRKDGSDFPVQVFVRKITWNGQKAYQRTFIDLTERNAAVTALRDSEVRHRSLFELAPYAVLVTDFGKILACNLAAVRLFAADAPEQLIGRNQLDLVHPDDRRLLKARMDEGPERTSDLPMLEVRRIRLDGSEFIGEARSAPFIWDGRAVRLLIIRDVTESRRAETALQESEARYRGLIEGSELGILISERLGKRKLINRACAEMFGYDSAEELMAMPPLALIAEYDRDRVQECREAYLEGRSEATYYEFDGVREDGSIFPVAAYMRRIEWDGEEAVQRTFIDLTDRRQAEQALIDSEARYRDLIEGSDLGIQISNRAGKRIFANPACVDLFGYDTLDELLAAPRQALVVEHDRARLVAYRKSFFDGDKASLSYECDGLRKDGSIVHLQGFMRRTTWNGEDAIQRTFIDITQRKKAEEQLRQAQKMEIVGQLTGGVAHDFNNLLTVILGNLDLLQDQLDDPDQNSIVQNAMDASRRGAELTQRLLAFSRKQALAPRSIDPVELLAGMADLMRRTLGEPIKVDLAGGADVWECKIDPAQLENAILNLAINARDAMPRGGTLTIVTENIHFNRADAARQEDLAPGDYVMISVADTGTGMTPEVAKRAIEPFFTTKDVGNGSGLGLSMVYGFVKQSGGNVNIETREGAGTTVTLWLPRSMETFRPEQPGDHSSVPESRGEKVLVVEDDMDVRDLTVQMLRGFGYEVMEASDGEEAIAIIKRTPGIDLLFSDVVLSGNMSGADVAREAAGYISGVSILYASGYTGDDLTRQGQLESGVQFIGKPFRKAELAQKVRAALDGRPG